MSERSTTAAAEEASTILARHSISLQLAVHEPQSDGSPSSLYVQYPLVHLPEQHWLPAVHTDAVSLQQLPV